MNIKIISWNVSFMCKPEQIAAFLREHISDYTIVNLQEVLAPVHTQLSDILKPDGVAFSLNDRKPGKYESANRSMGVATYVFNGRMVEHELVGRALFPERTLCSTLQFEGRDISVMNFQSLSGADYKKAKSSQYSALADFISSRYLDFFSCDANEPRIDALNENELIFFDQGDSGKSAGLLFGKNKVHQLSDAYKRYLNNKEKPGDLPSPLAVSYIVSKQKPRRFDHIYAADKWTVDRVSYPYEASIKASSDHSAVIGEFSLGA